MKVFYIGDSIPISATLSTDGSPKNLTGALVRVAILDSKKAILIPYTVIAIDGSPALGKVIGTIPSASTQIAYTRGADIPAYLEIETSISGVITTYGQEEVIMRPSPTLF